MELITGHYNYWLVIIIMMAGFYTVISRGNLVKKIAGLGISRRKGDDLQTASMLYEIDLPRLGAPRRRRDGVRCRKI